MMHHLLEKIANATTTADEVDGRVYGWIPGIVTDIDTRLFQVRARLGKQGDNESTEWLIPVGIGSIETLPEVGDPVGVIFQDGDAHRGAYFYFPQSTTKNRPAQPIPRGLDLVGMFNFVVTQLNQLRTDFNTLASQAAAHTHLYAPGPSPAVMTGPASGATPPISITATTALAANKGKASDGSVVADKSTSVVVLSKRSKVR